MRELEIGDIAWSIAHRCRTKEEVRDVLARLSVVDYQTLINKIEYESHQRECGLCREFKDSRTFTYVLGNGRVPPVCPECFAEKAIFRATCIGCLQVRPALVEREYTCSSCESIKKHVSNNNVRARKVHLPATLTLRQWVQAICHFDGNCAYCSKPYQCLDHYLPISLGGGSTSGNCLPCCYRCNLRKKDRHPDIFDSLFPAENLTRIRSWFTQQQIQEAS